MRPPKPRFEPKSMPPIPWQSNVRDLVTTLGLVWQASPLQASLIGLLSLAQAFVPVATLWISKLLLDAIAGAIGGQGSSVEVAFAQLLNLLLIQVGISVVSSLLSTVQTANRELLGDTLQNRISKRILEKSTQLELQQFEDPETYDRLQVAYREVGTQSLGCLHANHHAFSSCHYAGFSQCLDVTAWLGCSSFGVAGHLAGYLGQQSFWHRRLPYAKKASPRG